MTQSKMLLRTRTVNLGVSIYKQLNSDPLISTINKDHKRQLERCSSSVASNYRAACRSKSNKDFLNKLRIVEEEVDEVMLWIEFINAVNEITSIEILHEQYKEAEQILRMTVASINTTRNALNSKLKQ